MSSEEFYQEVFKNFPDANYFTITENHRQNNTFGQLTIPYREAILTGTAQERISVASDLLVQIPRRKSGGEKNILTLRRFLLQVNGWSTQTYPVVCNSRFIRILF